MTKEMVVVCLRTDYESLLTIEPMRLEAAIILHYKSNFCLFETRNHKCVKSYFIHKNFSIEILFVYLVLPAVDVFSVMSSDLRLILFILPVTLSHSPVFNQVKLLSFRNNFYTRSCGRVAVCVCNV